MVLTPQLNLKEKILMAEQKKPMQSMFGTPDRKGQEEDGNIQSEYPAWKMNSQINQLDEEITELSRDLSSGHVPSEDVFEAKEHLHTLQGRFDAIVRSKPNYNVTEEAFLHGELLNLNDRVSETLYSRYDQLKGKGSIARPQQEADLNDKPCISMHPEVARICNIKSIVNGKVSRNQADKARKILCEYFGRDDASRESIRPENHSGRSKPMVGFVNEAFSKRHREIFGEDNAPDPNNMRDYEKKQEGENLTSEQIKEKINKLKSQIIDIENHEEVNQIIPEQPKQEERKTKVDKTYICPEAGCGFIGRLNQKGAHIQKHNKEKAKADELKLAETE
jgi:hypothetical protein